MESRFLASANRDWAALDSIANKLPIVLGPAKISSWQSTGLIRTALHHSWLILSSVVVPLIILDRMRCDPNTYTLQRTSTNTAYRLFVSIGNGFFALLEDALHVWRSNSVGSDILSKIPIPGMVLMGIALRLPFRRHLATQVILASMNWPWVIELCKACRLDEESDASVNNIGWWTERWATLGFAMNTPQLQVGRYPCWLVGFFYHWWVEVLIPSIFVYLSECSSRSWFMRSMLSEAEGYELRLATQSRIILAGLISIVASQILWFAMKGIFTGILLCEKPGWDFI